MTEYVDFHLKANTSTLNFLKLSDLDKVHAIELGMKFLNMGNQNITEKVLEFQLFKKQVLLLYFVKLQLRHHQF